MGRIVLAKKFLAAYEESFARPLLRRACSTLRPAFVAIRLRKPCSFARCRFFGWYVRFGIVVL